MYLGMTSDLGSFNSLKVRIYFILMGGVFINYYSYYNMLQCTVFTKYFGRINIY